MVGKIIYLAYHVLYTEHIGAPPYDHTFAWLWLVTDFVFVPWTSWYLVIRFRSIWSSFLDNIVKVPLVTEQNTAPQLGKRQAGRYQ